MRLETRLGAGPGAELELCPEDSGELLRTLTQGWHGQVCIICFEILPGLLGCLPWKVTARDLAVMLHL